MNLCPFFSHLATGNNSTTELECLSACKSLDTQGYASLLVSALAEIPGNNGESNKLFSTCVVLF